MSAVITHTLGIILINKPTRIIFSSTNKQIQKCTVSDQTDAYNVLVQPVGHTSNSD